MEVSIHAVSLNFKDVLNFLLLAKDAYVGHDAPPLPGVDFSGVMMAIPIDANPDEACAFSVGDKVYGLSFDMLRYKARVLTDSKDATRAQLRRGMYTTNGIFDRHLCFE